MYAITANDLKTKGIPVIEAGLSEQSEVLITVRGKPSYVIMTMESYDYLRERELEAALQDVKRDMAEGRIVQESIDAHLERILQP